MPEYEYKCDNCGIRYIIVDKPDGDGKRLWDSGRIAHVIPHVSGGHDREWQNMDAVPVDSYDVCGAVKRVFSFNMAPVMQEHFNVTVGKPISDPRQFERELKEASEALEERTGIPHDFQPCDLTDKDALGVDDTGLKATHDAMVKAGTKAPTGRTVFSMGE